jgi:cytochrome P450
MDGHNMESTDRIAGCVWQMPTIWSSPFDPPAEFAELRTRGPVCRLRYPDGHLGWLVTDWAHTRAVLRDDRFSIRTPRVPTGDPTANAVRQEFAVREGSMVTDPPDHTVLRRLVADQFAVHCVDQRSSAIERIVAGRLNAMRETGPAVDLLSMLAVPVASLVICDLLGVSPDARLQFERLGGVLVDPASSAEELRATTREFYAWGQGLIEHKRAHLADDLLSQLVRATELTDRGRVGLMMKLFSAAGGDSTVSGMITLSTLLLLSEPGRWRALHDDPSLIPGAVEELLRYLGVVQWTFTRTASENVDLGGVLVQSGESVTISLAAANRDPAKFADPDCFDLTRRPDGHLAFGYGRHNCVGRHLARTELHITMAGLVREFPTLRLVEPPEKVPLHRDDRQFRGVQKLLVDW